MYIVDEMLLVPAMPWRFYMFRGLKDQMSGLFDYYFEHLPIWSQL